MDKGVDGVTRRAFADMQRAINQFWDTVGNDVPPGAMAQLRNLIEVKDELARELDLPTDPPSTGEEIRLQDADQLP